MRDPLDSSADDLSSASHAPAWWTRRRFCQAAGAAVASAAVGHEKLFAAPAAADALKAGEDHGPAIGAPKMSEFKIGMVVSSGGGPCQGLVGTAPVPLEWPEQKVKIVKEDISPGVRSDYRNINASVRQLIVSVPFLGANMEARALITYEVQRSPLTAPKDPSVFRLPAKIPNNIRSHLGPSPGIEISNAKIREHAKKVSETKSTAWEKVEALYDWTRETVKYENGAFRGAWAALKDGKGDCEELSSLFIALCRCISIPARTVWVPDHCYAEFYLEDSTARGYWIPCQPAGTRDFGGIPETRPILQKGDNFQVPERKGAQRYVAEYLTGKGGKPSVRFVRELSDPSL